VVRIAGIVRANAGGSPCEVELGRRIVGAVRGRYAGYMSRLHDIEPGNGGDGETGGAVAVAAVVVIIHSEDIAGNDTLDFLGGFKTGPAGGRGQPEAVGAVGRRIGTQRHHAITAQAGIAGPLVGSGVPRHGHGGIGPRPVRRHHQVVEIDGAGAGNLLGQTQAQLYTGVGTVHQPGEFRIVRRGDRPFA